MTVLFCDIANSTALAEQIGGETMHEVLNRFFELALQEVHRFGGTINQFLGDGFMALFGAPVAHEDHPRRAASSALAIQQALKSDIKGVRLQLRIGLNSGSVIVGNIGDNLRMDYTAVGDTTNLASRIEHAAVAGEIYLGESTYAAIQQYFECESLGERKVKGKAQRVSMYCLRGPRRADTPLGKIPSYSPIVGREREYSILEAALKRLRSGIGGIVGIVGEPGVGKSRLVAEVRREEYPDLRWTEARALSFGQTITYGAFIDILRNLAGIGQGDTHEEVWEKLRFWVAELAGSEGREHLAYIGTLMGYELPSEFSTLVGRLEAKDIRGQIYISTRRLIEKVATHGPTVLELDDWHWADDASASLLEHLLPLTETSPLLILFAGRPEAGTPCARIRSHASQRHAHGYVEILLGPLSSSDSNQVIDNLLPFADLPPRLRGAILERAEGNALFLEEVVQSLRSSGALRRDALTGRLHVAVSAEEIALPDRIEGLLMARIDRLEEDVKQVLKLAAVIGRSFYRRILEALDQAEHHLDECLEQLKQLELIHEKRALPELEFMFKHALVQEASYGSMLADRRRNLHKRVGEAIERLFADRLDEFVSFLAYHYSRAEDWEKAQHYLFRSGDQAVRMAADVEAMAHYHQAVAAYGRIYGERWDPLQRASLARKMGEALLRLGKDEQAVAQFRLALSYLGTTYPTSAIGVRGRIARELLKQVWHRIILAGSWTWSSSTDPADDETLQVYVCMSLIDYYNNTERFLLDVIAALNWAEQRGLSSGVSKGSMGVGVICSVLGLQRLAFSYHRRAVAFAQRAGDASAEALSLYGFGYYHFTVGRWDLASDHFIRSIQAFRSLGAIRELGIGIATLLWLTQWRGDVATFVPRSEELRLLAEEAGDRHLGTWTLVFASTNLAREGRLDEAVSMLKQAVEALKTIPDYQVLVEAYGRLADCYLRQGRWGEAVASLDEADQWIARKKVMGQATVYPHLARAWAQLARTELTDEAKRTASHHETKRACAVALRTGRSFRAAQAQALCILGSNEWLRGRKKAACENWRRSLRMGEQLGATYDIAITYREIGRHTGDTVALNTAIELFRKAGAAFDVARTLRYLGDATSRQDAKLAATSFRSALDGLTSMSARHELALTHAGFGRLYETLGRNDDAERHFSQATEILEGYGLSGAGDPSLGSPSRGAT